MNSLLRRIYRKAFPPAKAAAPAVNMQRGENTFVDPSCTLVTVDKGVIILEGNNYIGKQVELGTTGTIRIGDNTSLQDRCIILQDVEIGKSCVFAPNVYISSGRHYFDHRPNLYIKDQDQLVSSDPSLAAQHSKKVTIGDDCWLGINAVVMSGVTIGRGCVIGANSVVTKDVAPFTVVAGIPAKEIKKRLDFQQKKSIRFDREEDLPNFYKGFSVDLKHLEESRKNGSGGVYAGEQFTCYLSAEGQTVCIELQKLWHDTLTVGYNGQETKVESNNVTTVEFRADHTAYHEFTIKGQPTVLVKSVIIKD